MTTDLEAAQTAAFFIGVQDLLAASWWRGVGSGVLAALPSALTTAIQLFPIGSVAIAYQSVVLTARAVQGDFYHERLLFLRTDWLS